MTVATPSRSRELQDLAALLRGLREASGLSGERLAVRVGMSQSKISKIETGKALPSFFDVERILVALEVPTAARSEILEVARAANVSFVAWRTLRQGGIAERQAQVAAIEQQARLIRVFQPALVPGLLQTPDYARAVLSLPRLAGGHKSVSEAVAARMERQALLYDPAKRFVFVLMDSVLTGGPLSGPAMAVQRDHIEAVAKLDNVEVGVVTTADRLPEVPSNAFVLFDDRMVVVETFGGEMVLRDPRDIELHTAVFDLFAAQASR